MSDQFDRRAAETFIARSAAMQHSDLAKTLTVQLLVTMLDRAGGPLRAILQTGR